MANLHKHLENIQGWGLPVVVAINHFSGDTSEELAVVEQGCAALGVRAVPARHWAEGGAGALELARAVLELAAGPKPQLRFTYRDDQPLWEKARAVAQRIYGASELVAEPRVQARFQALEQAGFGKLPVCLAKTPYSFSTDPALRGRPTGFTVPVKDVRVAAGAGFVVVRTGDILTMPGLPRVPAAEHIDVDADGTITGLS
jgi:formate--tetrahydrofolate ligase